MEADFPNHLSKQLWGRKEDSLKLLRAKRKGGRKEPFQEGCSCQQKKRMDNLALLSVYSPCLSSSAWLLAFESTPVFL